MALPITIIRTYHQSELAPDGSVARLVRVDFKVGSDGPFNVSIPERDFTSDALQGKIREIANQVESLRSLSHPPAK